MNMNVFDGLTLPAGGSPKRARTEPSGSSDGGSGSAKTGINKKQADNLDHRMRQEESLNRTTFKFPKGSGPALIAYIKQGIDRYASHNPGSGPHPWGAKKNCLTSVRMKTIMEDRAKGISHVNSLFSKLAHEIDRHDALTAVPQAPTILNQLKSLFTGPHRPLSRTIRVS